MLAHLVTGRYAQASEAPIIRPARLTPQGWMRRVLAALFRRKY